MTIPDLSTIMEAAQRALEELGRTEVEGSSGGGMVKVRINGKFEVLSVTLDAEIVDPEDIEMLQDLIASAVADGLRKARALQGQKMAGLASGAGLDLNEILGKLGQGG